METCKARKCFRNKDLNHKMKGWNDFKRCDKKVFQDGFCKKCFSKDVRNYIGSKKNRMMVGVGGRYGHNMVFMENLMIFLGM
jgi:hypothetical protein